MDNRVREWYIFACKNLNVKPSVKGLKEYWYKNGMLFLDGVNRVRQIKNIYSQAKIQGYADFNKYPIEYSLPY